MKLELIIDGKNVDLFGDEPINLTYAIADVRNIFTRDTTFSLNFKLPSTENNNVLFSHLFDIKVNSPSFNPKILVKAQLYKDSVLILDGWFQLIDIEVDDLNKKYVYNGILTNYIYNFYSNIKDKTINNISFFQNTLYPSFTNADTFLDYMESTWTSFSTTADTAFATYPLVNLNNGWAYDTLKTTTPIIGNQLPVGIRMKKIVDELFKDAGYQYQSNFLNSQYFRNFMLVSPDKGEMSFKYKINLNLAFYNSPYQWYNDVDYYCELVATNIYGLPERIIHSEGNIVPAASTVVNGNIIVQWTGTLNKEVQLQGNGVVYQNETLKVRVVISPSNISGGGSFRNYIYLLSGSTWEMEYTEPSFSGNTFKVETDYVQHGEVVTGVPQSTVNGPAGSMGSRQVTWYIGWNVYFPSSPTNYIGHVVYNYANLFDTVEGFYSVTPPVGYSLYLSDKIKQTDFLIWLVNKFNLYLDWDNVNEKIIIEPREDYYKNSNVIRDWSDILDISKPQNIKLLSDDQPRNYTFTYNDDKDKLNTSYNDEFKEVYGTYKYTFDKKILTDNVNIEIGYSPTPLSLMLNSREILIPQILSDSNNNEKIDFNPRLLYWNGLQPLQSEAVWIKSDLPVTYSSYYDPTAKFNAVISNGSANNNSGSQTPCYSCAQNNYCVWDNYLETIAFQTDTLSSPNFNVASGKYTALNQGHYDFYCLLRPQVTLTNTTPFGFAGGNININFYISHYRPTSPGYTLLRRYLIGSVHATNAAYGTPVTTTAQIDTTLTNLSMNENDFIIVEAYYDSGNCGENLNFSWSLTVPNGYILSVNNLIQVNTLRRYNYYPYASEMVGQVGYETETIMFGPPQKLYFLSQSNNIYPDLGLFKKYWSSYLHEIESSESKLYTAYFNLKESDIATFKFSDLIFVDGTYYRINKIYYNVLGDETTKVELLKLDNLLVPIENQEVVKPVLRLANIGGLNVSLGTNNILNTSNIAAGNNNQLLRTTNSIVSGNENIIDGASSNILVNGNNNEVTDVNNVNINGNNNTVSLDNVTIINGSNNIIIEDPNIPPTIGSTPTTPNNITLIGMSNYSGSPTSNSVVVPNLQVNGTATLNGTNITSFDNRDGTINDLTNNILNGWTGTSDTLFNNPVTDIKVQPDGKILVGGSFTTFKGQTRNGLIRLNPDGTEDIDFYNNLGGGFSDTFLTQIGIYLTIQPDGKILVSGYYNIFNGNTRNYLVRLNPDGTEDTAFYTNLGSAFDAPIDLVILDKNNKIIVSGGLFTTFNGNARVNTIRLNPDGTEDIDFYNNGSSSIVGILPRRITIQNDNKILHNLYRNNSNGSIDYTLNVPTSLNTYNLEVINNEIEGLIIIGGGLNLNNGYLYFLNNTSEFFVQTPSVIGNNTELQFNDNGIIKGATYATYSTYDGMVTLRNMTLNGRQVLKPLTITTNYTVDLLDNVILVDTSSSPILIDLGGISEDGRKITIKDYAGNASINNISFSAPIDNNGAFVIDKNYGAVTIIYNGNTTTWFILNYYTI